MLSVKACTAREHCQGQATCPQQGFPTAAISRPVAAGGRRARGGKQASALTVG